MPAEAPGTKLGFAPNPEKLWRGPHSREDVGAVPTEEVPTEPTGRTEEPEDSGTPGTGTAAELDEGHNEDADSGVVDSFESGAWLWWGW